MPKGSQVTPTPEEEYAEWTAYVEAAYKEIIHGWWNRRVFRGLHEMFRTNPALQATEGSATIFDWLRTVYEHYAVMLVRREADSQSGTWNLKQLLHDLEKHHEILVDFARGSQVPSAAEIAGDREELERGTAKVVDYSHRFVAHRTQPGAPTITMADIDDGLRAVRSALIKYYGVLTGSDLGAVTPIAQFYWLEPFTVAWLPDGFREPEPEEERRLSEDEKRAREQQRQKLGFVP